MNSPLIPRFLKILFFSFISLGVQISYAQSPQERSQLCNRSYLIESVRFLENPKIPSDHFEYHLSTTQNLLNTCRSSLPQLGFSNTHLDQVEQQFRIRSFAEEEKKFLERRSLLSAEELVELGRLAKQRPDILSKRYRDFLDKKQSECSPVDLRSKLPPVRDQDSIGWCYAFAAADLASFETGKEISAVGMAVAFNETKRVQPLKILGFEYDQKLLPAASLPESQIESGDMESAIRKANEVGYCLESEVPSDDFGHSELKVSLQNIESLAANNTSTLYPPEGKPSSPQVMNSQRSTASLPNTLDPEGLCEPQAATPLTPHMNFFEFDQILQESDSSNIVKKLVERSCQNPLKLNLEVESKYDQLADRTHELLNNGQILSFAYDANVLRNLPISDRPTHGSLIVGRRWNQENQKCELLVRNSWGTTCAPYSYPCEEGNIWIPDHVVMNATFGITYVNK